MSDKNEKELKFIVGSAVYLLLPNNRKKLLLQWKAPVALMVCYHSLNYVLNVVGTRKNCYVNMIKQYENSPKDRSRKLKKPGGHKNR